MSLVNQLRQARNIIQRDSGRIPQEIQMSPETLAAIEESGLISQRIAGDYDVPFHRTLMGMRLVFNHLLPQGTIILRSNGYSHVRVVDIKIELVPDEKIDPTPKRRIRLPHP